MNSFSLPTVKKVVVIGPECTGKSELTEFLAEHYNTKWVPEYARAYIDNLARPYTQHDLLSIAHGQMRIEDEWSHGSRSVMFCDTNLYVIKIWSEFKFGSCHEEIVNHIATRTYDLYLLTYIDVPWQADPQRENPDKRAQLYDLYLTEMKNQPTPFLEIKGEREQRRTAAIAAVEKMLK